MSSTLRRIRTHKKATELINGFYDNDSILLFKTTVKQVCTILKLKEKTNPNEYSINNWDGFDAETGKRTKRK